MLDRKDKNEDLKPLIDDSSESLPTDEGENLESVTSDKADALEPATTDKDQVEESSTSDSDDDLESPTSAREYYLKSLTHDLDHDLKSLIFEFLYNENEIKIKKAQFYQILQALPLLKRKDFIDKIPKVLLETIHSDLDDFKETLLALPIDEQYSFISISSEEHIKKVFLTKPIEETLESLDIRKHVKTPLPSGTLYHTERNLLVFLTRAYRYTVADKISLYDRTRDLERLINFNDEIDSLFILDTSENATLLLIFKRFKSLFKERYQQFKAPPGQIHVVLDLDDTVVTHTEEKDLNSPGMKWFLENKLVIQAIVAHLIHPGAIELIQFIFSIPHVRVSFFSRGIEERNFLLVNALLSRALGVEVFNAVKDSVTVFSRNDLNSSIQNAIKIAHSLGFGNLLKNLNKMTSPEQLDNTILIEDDPSYCFPGQERNMLIHRFVLDSVFTRSFDDTDDIYRANHIFYIAGVLKLLLINREHHSLADTLFKFQFANKKEDRDLVRDRYPYTELFWERQRTHRYYREGLALLQLFNPKLDFYGGENARHLLNTDLNPNDYSEIQSNQIERTKPVSHADLFSNPSQAFKVRMFSFLNSDSIAAMRSVSKTWNYHCNSEPYRVKSPGLKTSHET